jgi:hypothetical protein
VLLYSHPVTEDFSLPPEQEAIPNKAGKADNASHFDKFIFIVFCLSVFY